MTTTSNVGADASREWQPIETVPDGDVVDVWSSDTGRHTSCKRSDYYNAWLPSGSMGHGRDHIYRVTHWMPLPTPPAGETE